MKMGELRRAAKGEGTQRRTEVINCKMQGKQSYIGLPVQPGSLHLNTSPKSWEAETPCLPGVNSKEGDKGGEKQNKEKCVANGADKNQVRARRYPSILSLLSFAKSPSEIIRRY